MAFRLAHRAD